MHLASRYGSSSPVCAVRLAACFCLPSPVKESILHTNFWLANPWGDIARLPSSCRKVGRRGSCRSTENQRQSITQWDPNIYEIQGYVFIALMKSKWDFIIAKESHLISGNRQITREIVGEHGLSKQRGKNEEGSWSIYLRQLGGM